MHIITLTALASRHVRSTTETSAVGTRKAIPVSFLRTKSIKQVVKPGELTHLGQE